MPFVSFGLKDASRHKADALANASQAVVLDKTSGKWTVKERWEVAVGDFVKVGGRGAGFGFSVGLGFELFQSPRLRWGVLVIVLLRLGRFAVKRPTALCACRFRVGLSVCVFCRSPTKAGEMGCCAVPLKGIILLWKTDGAVRRSWPPGRDELVPIESDHPHGTAVST